MQSRKIVAVGEADREGALAALVAAFVADPFIRWMFPEPARYFEYGPQVLRHFGGGAFEHDSAHRSDDFSGTALWLPPGVSPDEEALGAVIEEGASPDRLADAFAVLEQVGGGHPDEPHWYLPAIGVDPLHQGQGLGSALLAHHLEACDRAHVAAYLESTNPANIPLYLRFGFEITGRFQTGGSPVVTPMFRAAR